ncbi:NAD+ synthase [Ectothiorhodospiraceae bacterium 2226]|nr:NAD+ synthase [Ectothiorhodospiraceae bacterium 2226]
MADASRLRIALAQQDFLVGAVQANADKLVATALRARDELQADVVVFPELTLTGYPPEDLLLRPDLYPRIERAVGTIREQVSGIHVVFGFAERTDTGLYNSALVLRDGREIARYRKQRLPNYGVFDEKRYFEPGAAATVFEVSGVRLGLTVCEDLWAPGPARQAADAGAQMLLNLNASPYHIDKGRERERTVRARVQETGLPVVYVNLAGAQDELVFDGESFVMDAEGSVTHRLPAFAEALEVVAFEGTRPQPAAAIAQPLEEAASVYQALVTGVRAYVEHNGFPGALIGLSGGIDSALTLAVAVDALGPERVQAVMMPSRYTADISLQDAEAQARMLGVPYSAVPIEPMFNVFLEGLAPEFAGAAPDTTEENIQARCRGVILMALSNKRGSIVLTTGNKSEYAVGYATLYGDMAGGYAVLKDVPKTLVYRLAEYRNGLGAAIPQRVIDRPPSAELRPDQRDTDSLPPYDILDAIVARYVEEDQDAPQIIAAGFDEETVRRIIRLIERNEYKRRQAAPGVRITRRAFSRDRRYPITQGYTRES